MTLHPRYQYLPRQLYWTRCYGRAWRLWWSPAWPSIDCVPLADFYWTDMPLGCWVSNSGGGWRQVWVLRPYQWSYIQLIGKLAWVNSCELSHTTCIEVGSQFNGMLELIDWYPILFCVPLHCVHASGWSLLGMQLYFANCELDAKQHNILHQYM